MSKPGSGNLDRRRFLSLMAALGAAGGALVETARAEPPVDSETVRAAERLAGLTLTDEERELMIEGLADLREDYRELRKLALPNSVPPAFRFDPRPPGLSQSGRRAGIGSPPAPPGEGPSKTGEEPPPQAWAPPIDQDPSPPGSAEDLAYSSLAQLGALLRKRAVSSVELTRAYLQRIEALDPILRAVVTVTGERALEEAEAADREIARGRYRGPLHGVPWGAKDLLAAAGYPTTWGATPYRGQEIPEDATVVRRLREAGAVLVAKLTLGALAWGDVWFGGKTRNPWDPEDGASGSSAGPAAATAAGMVGFSIGSETWGSIVSPSTRCGVTGLRPTFGRVSRHGAMALSWTMDKLGPMCRSAEDCALVFAAIHGADGRDPTTVDEPFAWPAATDPRRLTVGYTRSLFEAEPEEGEEETHALDLAVLDTLRSLGFDLVPVELPDGPVRPLAFVLSCEAAAAFEELTLSGRDDLLVRQQAQAWPNVFRQARFIPAVEYIQANRARTLLMERTRGVLSQVDVLVTPTFGGDQLLLTNLTGHPAVVLPSGFKPGGTPHSITFLASLYQEAPLLAVAHVYQQSTGSHLRRPPLTAG